MKTCMSCRVDKSLEFFCDDKTRVDGKFIYCKECCNRKSKEYRSNNIEKVKVRKRIYQQNNREHIKEYLKKYSSTEKYKDRRNRNTKERYKTDIQYRTKIVLRNQFRKHIMKEHKKNSVLKIIGCSIDSFNKWIENKFTDGMSWSNQGKWHYDHIIPCDYFDLTIQEEQEKCFHYTNFQPLWSEENNNKNYNLPDDFNKRVWKGKEIGWVVMEHQPLPT